MNNEKEILLDSEEIQQLLEGGLFWKDIEPKLSHDNPVSFQRRMIFSDQSLNDKEEDKEVAREVINFYAETDIDDDKKVRAILLGENNIIKDRQIDLSHIQEVSAASGDEGTEADIIKETNQNFSANDPDSVLIFSNELDNNEQPSFRGWKLVVLMIIVAVLTFGFWFYFLGR